MEEIEIFPPYIVVNSGFVLVLVVVFIVFVMARIWSTLRRLPSRRDLELV
jgi:hypothetical protein